MTADRPKPYTFFIRGLQMTTVVERMFHVESAAERSTWLEAIEGVKRRLEEVKEPGGAVGIGGVDEEMREQDDEDPFETIFAKRGEVQKKSGSKKVVSSCMHIGLIDRSNLTFGQILVNFEHQKCSLLIISMSLLT